MPLLPTRFACGRQPRLQLTTTREPRRALTVNALIEMPVAVGRARSVVFTRCRRGQPLFARRAIEPVAAVPTRVEHAVAIGVGQEVEQELEGAAGAVDPPSGPSTTHPPSPPRRNASVVLLDAFAQSAPPKFGCAVLRLNGTAVSTVS